MALQLNLHKNQHVDSSGNFTDLKLHLPKGFGTVATVNDQLTKDERGELAYEERQVLLPALSFVNSQDAPPTEVDGDIYVFADGTSINASWDSSANLSDWVRYNGAEDYWYPISPSVGIRCWDSSASLDMRYDGTNWTNAATPSLALNDLTDVTITSATSGDTLRYDGTSWVNNNVLKNDGTLIEIANTLDIGSPSTNSGNAPIVVEKSGFDGYQFMFNVGGGAWGEAFDSTANAWKQITQGSTTAKFTWGHGTLASPVDIMTLDKTNESLAVGSTNTGLAGLYINNCKVGLAAARFDSTCGGFLKPRVTTAERDLFSGELEGEEIYNTSTGQPEWYDGTSWQGSPLNISVVTKTGAYTAVNGNVVLSDASSGGFTVTLPAAASNANAKIDIKKIDATGNIVTIDGNASETIDGGLTATLLNQYESITLVCDGANWYII